MTGLAVEVVLIVAAVALVLTAYRLGLRARGRVVVSLEVGQRIAEPDGREWTIVGRTFTAQAGGVPTLRVDLGLRSDPS